MDEVDYLILGGGTAGCVLAARLTESGRHRVALVEAGGTPRSPFIRVPAGFGHLLRSRRHNWGYASTPDPGTDGRVIPIPGGRGLGGSGLINGMVYVRGQAADYDGWAAAGADGWAYADVEPWFRRIEDDAQAGRGRGRGGPLHVTRIRERFPIADAFLRAAVEDGGRLVDDYNVEQAGFGYYQLNQHRGRRWSPYDAYLAPARSRPALRVMTGTLALGLTFDGGRCTGATLARGRTTRRIRARRGVILAAGAIRTPQLLELSGVGRPEVLEAIGVPVRHALAGVGEHYADHYAVRMNWRLRGIRSLNESTRGWRLAAAGAQYLVRRTGILTLGPALCHGFVATDPADGRPDTQFLFMHASYEDASRRVLDREPGMTIGIIQQRPRSTGSIHSASPDPLRAPAIRPRFLSDPEDRARLVAGMRRARSLVARPALAPFIAREMNPGPLAGDDDALLRWARATGQTLYHPCGTCRMGTGDDAVVDPRLRVRGIDGLWVADASVMPSITSGNIHAPVLMIAERAAAMIAADA
ncbi:GMC family oxidoreductase [Miltoncostaea oceani]|uniref:GMC family oxidoreductase n=1 Tax=Miltoncostaea oceani TaxID=2843216 RepID=UPI001C3CB729|nr:GMC family oxidoreductase N-terminal domain-containing protein [Miltoncostaea oceani]